MCLCLKGVWRNLIKLKNVIIFLVRIMIILVYFIYNTFYSSVVREFLSALKIDIYMFTVYDNCTTTVHTK